MTSDTDPSAEVEISLENETELELQRVDIDSADFPLEFSVDGVIRDIDADVMDELRGKDLEPVAVRFRLLSNDE